MSAQLKTTSNLSTAVRLSAEVPNSGPRDQSGAEAAFQLLQFEAQMRHASTSKELAVLVANGARSFVRARQGFVFEIAPTGAPSIFAVTDLANVDPDAPLIAWIEQIARRHLKSAAPGLSVDFMLQSYAADDDQIGRSYPFKYALWLPLEQRDKVVFGGLLFTRESAWSERDVTIGRRLAATMAHAWLALSGSGGIRAWRRFDSARRRKVAAAVLLAALFPVSMTALAPLEIAPRDAFPVTAPIDGVIEALAVRPNEQVHTGQLLLKFTDTVLRNKHAIAEREVAIADARLKKTMQQAFTDVRGRHEIGLAQTEVLLKRSERDFAREVLSRTQVKAARSGVATFGDPRELVGKPVATGEKIMEIADPNTVEVRLDVSVSDAALLRVGTRVKAFLDSDPLRPIEGKVVRADYKARVREGGLLSVRAVAELDDKVLEVPRLGLRGTAQIYDGSVPLVYFLLRRPISASRQWLGL